jgi:hypothetical protein
MYIYLKIFRNIYLIFLNNKTNISGKSQDFKISYKIQTMDQPKNQENSGADANLDFEFEDSSLGTKE